MQKFINILFTALLFSFFNGVQAQPKLVEEVVAVVGDNILLRSELQAEIQQAQNNFVKFNGDMRCEYLNQLIIQKLLLSRAETDSVTVDDARVEQEIGNRIRFYASQIGGEEALEEYLGKTITEYKASIFSKVKEQLVIQEMQNKMMGEINASPQDVQKYFNELPKDSLPLFDAQVELAQLVVYPKPNNYAKEYAYNTLKKYREQIVSGESNFSSMALAYSDDPGSAQNGGELGYFTRGQMVPEFERTAYKLKKDSISEIIETTYGYHILQLVDRKGERINVRHILIRPKIIEADRRKARETLQKAVNSVKTGEMEWCDVVKEYSDDEQSAESCGFFTDPNNGGNLVDVAMLDQEVTLQMKSLNPGDFGEVHIVRIPDGTMAYRVLYLKSEVEPHKANLKQDYQKIQAFALERKKEEALAKWAEEFSKSTYLKIDERYSYCPELKKWESETASTEK